MMSQGFLINDQNLIINYDFSSDDAKKKDESAEEGECNDDGVELRPSLRFT